MFSWTTTRRNGTKTQGSRRAFRPETDRLETREVLSTLALAGGSTPQFLPGVHFNTQAQAFTGAANLQSLSTALHNAGSTFFTPSFMTSSTPFSSLPGNNNSNTASLANLTKSGNLTTAAGHARTLPREAGVPSNGSLPREAGLANNVNPNLFFTGGRAGPQVFALPPINATQANASLRNGSAVTNGLAFTNGLGFSSPAQSLNTANNAVQSGLAFTNGLGNSLPAGFSPFFNSVTSGLTFSNGNRFTNPTPFPIGTSATSVSGGLGGSSITIGNNSGSGFSSNMFGM